MSVPDETGAGYYDSEGDYVYGPADFNGEDDFDYEDDADDDDDE